MDTQPCLPPIGQTAQPVSPVSACLKLSVSLPVTACYRQSGSPNRFVERLESLSRDSKGKELSFLVECATDLGSDGENLLGKFGDLGIEVISDGDRGSNSVTPR